MLPWLSSGEFLSLACALTWAIAVLFFRKSGEHVTPVALNLFKNSVALLLFLLTLPLLKIPYIAGQHTAADWLTLLASGAIGIGVADSLFFASLNRLGASNSAVVDSLYSPFVIFSAWIYLREPIGLSVLVAMALMVGAIVVATWKTGEGSRGTSRQVAVSVVMGVVAMFLMAVGIVLAKPVLAHADAWWVTTVRLMGGAGVLAVHAMFGRHRPHVLKCFTPSRAWLYTIPAAVVGAYVALILWIQGMKHTYASVASVLNQTSTVFIMILAAVFLKEKITGRKLIAIGLAFAGTLVVTF